MLWGPGRQRDTLPPRNAARCAVPLHPGRGLLNLERVTYSTWWSDTLQKGYSTWGGGEGRKGEEGQKSRQGRDSRLREGGRSRGGERGKEGGGGRLKRRFEAGRGAPEQI